MTTYKQNKIENSKLKVNQSQEGETIEMKMERVINNGEAIKDGAPLVYTDRKDGVKPEFDIRTDRFEIAIDAMDKVSKSVQAKRDERGKINEADAKIDPNKNSGAEPIHGN